MFKVSAEVEETISRIEDDPHVIGSIVMNNEGNVLRTSVEATLTSQYAIPLSNFSQSAMKIVRDLDPANELRFIRISCTKYDILMATLEFGTVVVMQKPTVTFEIKETDDYGMVFPEQHSAPFKSMSF